MSWRTRGPSVPKGQASPGGHSPWGRTVTSPTTFHSKCMAISSDFLFSNLFSNKYIATCTYKNKSPQKQAVLFPWKDERTVLLKHTLAAPRYHTAPRYHCGPGIRIYKEQTTDAVQLPPLSPPGGSSTHAVLAHTCQTQQCGSSLPTCKQHTLSHLDLTSISRVFLPRASWSPSSREPRKTPSLQRSNFMNP